MRMRLLGVLVMAVLTSGSLSAQEALSPDPRIQGTIQSQIDAFLQDDFVTAFTFASPSIKSIFRTPENFGAMVRTGYPMVWRPSDVRFGPLREIEGALWQQVLVQDANGQGYVLEYRMEQIDGTWLISGVRVVPASDVAA